MDLSEDKVEKFGNLLKKLAQKPPQTHHPLEAAILNDVLVHFIPANTVHPLEDIIGNQSESYFLISKVHLSEENKSDKENSFTDCSDSENVSGELQEEVVKSKLSFTKIKKVTAGSPISQEVVYMSKQEPFHPVGEKELLRWYISCDVLNPCSIKEARYYISLYTQGLKSSNLRVPLWVMCNGALPQRVIFMGTLPKSGSDCNTVRNILVKEKGPFTSQEALPPLEQTQKRHLASIRGNPNTEVVMHGYAKYDLLGLEKCDLQGPQSSLIMEFQWGGVRSLFESPPMSSNGLLHIMAVPGDMKSATQNIFTEVQQLLIFSECLACEVPNFLAEDNNLVGNKIQEFLSNNMETTKLPQEKSPDEALNDSDGDLASPMSKLLVPEFIRDDLDFTEQLWGLMRNAVDYEDMWESLMTVLMAIVQGEVQPVVYSTNHTLLGNFIRDSFQCESFEERSKLLSKWKYDQTQENLIPLQSVVEIGIEKLRRDFTNYFIGQELTTLNQLEYYLQKDIDLSAKVELLQRLHNILELLVRCKGFVQLSHENLRLLMQAGLAYYKTHPATDHPFFSLSFPTFKSSSLVKEISTVHQPTVWKVAMTTESQSEKSTSVIELSSKPHLATNTQNFDEVMDQNCSMRQSYRVSVDDTFVGGNILDDKEPFVYLMFEAMQFTLQIM